MIGLLIIIGVVLGAAYLFWHHQRRLKMRAYLMREALHNHDFSFRLPTKGMAAGERAIQQLLNDMGQEIRLLMAQQEVGSWLRLTRVLTHEIMNATAPIQSITQSFLDRPDVKGSPLEDGIRAIRDTSAGLTSFVECYRKSLNELSGISERMRLQNIEPQNFCVREVVESIQTLYPSLNWRTDITADITAQGDAYLMRQVLTNIVKNAQEAGATTIDVRWVTDSLLVSNDGSPIPAEVRSDIFVPFFTTKRTGSGIGLALSRQMMVMQGGNLSLADKPQSGYHVTFVIRL